MRGCLNRPENNASMCHKLSNYTSAAIYSLCLQIKEALIFLKINTGSSLILYSLV